MQRFFNWIKGLFNRAMDKVEDPEIMLDQARRDMQQSLLANKEKAIQAMTMRNRLANMLEDEKKKSQTYENQAAMALKQGNRELATKLMREKMTVDGGIAGLQQSYEQANATVDQVKVAMKRQEEEVRKKTAEALRLKTQYKQAQIQVSINKALEGLTFENQYGSFGAAEEKINMKTSEAQARQEMYGQSIAGQVAGLEDASRDMEAESELERLEERLGMRPAQTAEAPAVQTVGAGGAPPPVGESAVSEGEADKALEELERRLKGDGSSA